MREHGRITTIGTATIIHDISNAFDEASVNIDVHSLPPQHYHWR